MGNFWMFVLLLMGGLCLKETIAENTTYVVALLGQDIQNGTVNTDIEYELVLTSESIVSVTITGIDGLVETLDVTDKKVHVLESTKGMNGSEYSNKTLIVHSSDGHFTLQVFTKREDTSHIEGFLGIPIQALIGPRQPVGQTVYSYVVATFCDVGGYCQLAVAALNDNTLVSIVLPSNVDEVVFCRNKAYFRSKRDTTITLNKFDSLQIESTYDLTGTVIYSFEPIVVFAGSRNVTNGEVIAHTVEQLVPASHWGKEYIVTNLGTNGYGDILKIVSHWSETKITMKGFPSFIIKGQYETAVRRLDSSSHIVASNPIQVIQISGLTYATENETSTLSMTVIPSVQNAITAPIKVACHGESAETGQLYIVSEKLNKGSTEVNGNSYKSSNEDKIKYSNYMIGPIEHSNDIFTIENTAGPVSGVLKCGTATMPIAVTFKENVTGTTTPTASYNGGTCYEGGKASTIFYSVSGTATPHSLSLETYPDHVLELRVRACGEAVLQFLMNNGTLTNSLFVTVTHTQMTVTKCFPDCGNESTTVIDDVSGFNADIAADWDCQSDMAFFWFHQKATGGNQYFCMGTGRYQATDCDGDETDSYFQVSSPFKAVNMMGVASDADFTWDFIHSDGCDLYESNWRCFDRWTNCSLYGNNFCTNADHSQFAISYCAKYCGKCFPDSYGHKFLVKIPMIVAIETKCLIVVSPLNTQTNVAVTLTNHRTSKENVRHGTRNDNGERLYDCEESLGIINQYTILSDDDVSVLILVQFKGEMKSFRVYPVDTFGTEFMLLEYSDVEKECRFLSEHKDVNYAAYYTVSKLGGEPDSKWGPLLETSALAITNLNDPTGTLFVFDKPSTVYCGDRAVSSAVTNYYYNQLLPTTTWSMEYIVPAFDVVALNRPFEGKLFIVANADNTIVNISRGFDAIHAVYNRGDKVEQEIDVAAAYKIQASEKIGVGLYLYDPSNARKSAFFILPPAENFHNTIITSVPNNVLNTQGFEVTELNTYFVDKSLNSEIVRKPADDTDPFYRHVRLGDHMYSMSVVRSGTEKWFVVPGNIKSTSIPVEKGLCSTSVKGTDDNVDNDCDGLVDEDGCSNGYGVYREDQDLDGGFGEDCKEVLNEPVVVSPPIEPMCLVIDKPKDQCWTVCTCKCSWVEKYEAQKNLTHDELVEAQQEEIQHLQSELQVDAESLPSASAEKESASDQRQSAANIGYIGIGLFVLVFGTIFIMDITSLVRDARILFGNLREGFGRLTDCFS